jgi:hypothetical protein
MQFLAHFRPRRASAALVSALEPLALCWTGDCTHVWRREREILSPLHVQLKIAIDLCRVSCDPWCTVRITGRFLPHHILGSSIARIRCLLPV